MSLLYKEAKDLKYYLDIKQEGDRVVLSFSADCGKFGTNEQVDEYTLSIDTFFRLLEEARDKGIFEIQ